MRESLNCYDTWHILKHWHDLSETNPYLIVTNNDFHIHWTMNLLCGSVKNNRCFTTIKSKYNSKGHSKDFALKSEPSFNQFWESKRQWSQLHQSRTPQQFKRTDNPDFKVCFPDSWKIGYLPCEVILYLKLLHLADLKIYAADNTSAQAI